MRKFTCVCLILTLILSYLPVICGAGAIAYELNDASGAWMLRLVEDGVFAPTLNQTATAVFTAPGTGTVEIPETVVKAEDNDGARVRILKAGSEVISYSNVDGTTTVPALSLHVMAGDTLTFEADARAIAGDAVTWDISLAYIGGIAEAEAPVNFIDLNNHWAKSYAVPLAEEGIIKGKTVNRFDPDGQITRAEFLTLALKVANLPTEIYQSSYADVTESQWFAKVAHTTQKADILAPEMVINNNLLPDAPILREEMTAVIMRLIDVMRGTIVDPAHSFTDAASFSAWANDYIGKAAKLGIVTGNPDGSFNALGTTTRGEAAVMFFRLKTFLEETPLFTPAGEYSPVYDTVVYEDVDLNQMINDAIAAGQKKINIEPGAYRIKTTPRGGHIVLKDVKDVTINGNGSTLLLQTMGTSGISLSNCENVTINGFNIDWEKPNVAQGQIFNIDPDGFYIDITVEPGYPNDFLSGRMYSDGMSFTIYDGVTYNQIHYNSGMITPMKAFEQLGPNTWRINSAKVAKDPDIKIGDYIGARAYNMSAATYFVGCKDIKLTNINVWGALSSLNDVRGEGNTLYENVKLDRGPKPLGTITPRMISTQGDGVHCTALRVGPKVINSVFAHQLDDGLNIHGSYGKVAAIQGNQVILAITAEHPDFRVGDDVRFYSPTTVQNSALKVKTFEEYASASEFKPEVDLVQEMGSGTFRPGRYVAVTFENGNKNYKVGDWIINRSWTSSNFEIRNSVFTNSRSRSCLVKSSNGIIENCEFSYGAGYGLWIAPEFNWLESGYSENVIVRNCTFFRNGWGGREASGGLSISGEAGQDHHNITVENNVFYENYNADLYLADGTDFIVRNNTFKHSDAQNATYTIDMNNLDKVALRANTYEAGRKNLVHVGDNVTNLTQK